MGLGGSKPIDLEGPARAISVSFFIMYFQTDIVINCVWLAYIY